MNRALPWYRQVNREQWKAFLATFAGWVLDGFDATIITFVLIDIQKSFAVDKALAGALGTVTLFFRLIGGVAAGAVADRWGRKLPLMLSILWFSLFAFLSGFSTSYAMLFAFRALFGIGMGGEWAAGMPLALEHWPAHLRGTASGLLQGGFSWGFILSAADVSLRLPSVRPSAGSRVAGDVLDRRDTGAARALDPHRSLRESRLARPATAPAVAPGEENLAPSDLPRRSRGYHRAVQPPDGRPDVFLLLDFVLVSDLLARIGSGAAPLLVALNLGWIAAPPSGAACRRRDWGGAAPSPSLPYWASSSSRFIFWRAIPQFSSWAHS